MKTLPQISNPKTGSVFYTIAEHESGPVGSIRLFIEKGAQKNHTLLAFRFRVEMGAGHPVPANMEHYLSSVFPAANWSSKNQTHCSLAGLMAVDRPIWNIDEVIATLVKTFAFELLYDRLGYEFPQFTWGLTKPEFVAFCVDQVTQLLTKGAVDSTSAQAGVIFNFGAYQKLLSQGVPTEPADIPSAVIQQEPEEESAVINVDLGAEDDQTIIVNATVSGGGALGPVQVKVHSPDSEKFKASVLAQAQAIVDEAHATGNTLLSKLGAIAADNTLTDIEKAQAVVKLKQESIAQMGAALSAYAKGDLEGTMKANQLKIKQALAVPEAAMGTDPVQSIAPAKKGPTVHVAHHSQTFAEMQSAMAGASGVIQVGGGSVQQEELAPQADQALTPAQKAAKAAGLGKFKGIKAVKVAPVTQVATSTQPVTAATYEDDVSAVIKHDMGL